MRYLLDTNIVSYALRGEGRVGERILQSRPSELGVSAISVAELRYGASKRGSDRLHGLIDQFLESVRAVPFDSRAADTYGRIESALRDRGTPIGLADTLIGAHALALEVTLVTHNSRHFERIEGLALEDWFG